MSGGEWPREGTPVSRSSSASSSFRNNKYSARNVNDGGKRPYYNFEYVELADGRGDSPQPKRPRYVGVAQKPMREPPFYILREAAQPPAFHSYDHDETGSPSRNPSLVTHGGLSDTDIMVHHSLRSEPRPALVGRTSSGLRVAQKDEDSDAISSYSDMKKDEQAANRVERHFAHYHKGGRESKAERILKSLVSPRSTPGRPFEIDDAALNNIFRAANEIFFFGSLRNRVKWDWSEGLNEKHHAQIIGTTALREAKDGGNETLIVLSRRYLEDTRYNRRLLISTFIHELIHSYLFIRCGINAKRFGGHTVGFRRIARLIDEWTGPDTLFLSNIEADLEDFADSHHNVLDGGTHHNCGMQYSNDVNGVPPATLPPDHWPGIRFMDRSYLRGDFGPP